MSQTIKLKRSAVAGKVPTTSSLDLGEVAINTNDGKVFLKKDDGTQSIQTIVTTDSLTTGSINLTGAVSASYFTGSFTGDGANLDNIRLFISGIDLESNPVAATFSKLHFDSTTGIYVSASDADTAFVELGSHFRDIFVDGSATLVATGSDQLDVIAGNGLDITTSLTDTNSNSVSKELIFAVDNTIATTGSNSFVGNQDISGSLRVSGSGDHYFSDGNVGIGTTSPDNLLHVESTSSGTSPIITVENDNDIKLKLGTVRSGAGTAPNTSFIAYDADLRFLADADGVTEVVRFDSSGNVGIGINPSGYGKLTVNGTGNLLTLRASSGAGQLGFYEGGTGRFFLETLNGLDGLAFIDGDSSTERMRIDSSGNVGIGETTPDSLLHLSGSSNNAIITLENNGNGNVSGIDFVRERSTGTGVNGGSLFLESNTGGTQSFLYLQAQTASADAGVTSALTAGNGVRLILKGGQGIFSVETGASEAFKIVNGDATFYGDLTVGGKVTAQEFHTEFVSASIIYQSGSTKFGDTTDDLHEFTGSVDILTDTSAGNRSFIISGAKGPRLQRRGDSVGWAYEYGFNANDDTDLGGFGALGTGNSGFTYYYIGAAYNDTSMVVLDTGEVGIGTTSPSAKLHVADGGNPTILIEDTNSDNQARVEFKTATYNWVTGLHGGENAFKISNNSSFGTNDFLTVKDTGNVGIGTTSPLYPLSLESATSGLISRIYNTNADGQGLLIRAGATSSATRVLQVASSNDTKIMTVNSNGNVGIGTTSPGTKLEVNGTATVTSLVETSTRKLKDNIKDLEDQSSIVDCLTPVSYTWKESKEEDFGLIAEDVAEIAPHLVQRDSDGNPSGIKYSKLSVLLLDVVQRQSTLIEDLNKRITILENERG